MTRQTNITVASVLSLDILRSAELLAGRRGLDRRVAGVNIIEVPDVARWLKGREFLLSSAYLWRDRPDEMRDLIVHLDEVGVAALGHKPSAHMPRVPDQVLDFADERGFPIVQLPQELAYREVLEGVYMLLFGNHRSRARPDMATRLDLDPNDHSMAETVRRLAVEFRSTLEVVDRMEGLSHTVTPDGSVTTRPLLLDADDVSAGAVRPGADHEPQQVAVDSQVAWMAPLVVDGQVQGRLKVVGDSRITDLETVMEVTDLLSLLQIRRRAYRQGLHGALDLTFRELARGTLSEEEVADRAQLLGLRDGAPWVLAIVSMHRHNVSRASLSQLRPVLDRQLPSHVTVVDSDPAELSLALLVRGDDRSIDSVIDCVRETARSVLGSAPSVHMGFAVTTSNVHDVPVSLRQARIALDVAVAKGASRVCFGDLGAEAVLAQVAGGGVAETFVRKRLGTIEDPELLRTLELYVAFHGNKSATANAIPMHRSGLLYRLNKIGSLLGADLNDPEIMNEIWLALKLRRVLAVGS